MTITLWRITRRRYQQEAYSGEGSRRYGGRFNSPGMAVVYTSGSLALAILELMANLDDYDPGLLEDYVAVPATIESSYVQEFPYEALPADWRAFPHPPSTRAIGDRWLAEASSPALAVPSAVVPRELNYLLNPAHKDFRHLTVGEPETLTIDPRLLTTKENSGS